MRSRASVSSLYLLDRDGSRSRSPPPTGSTATRSAARVVPFGEGITGRVAAVPPADGHPRRRGRPAVPVGPGPRPAPVRRLDAVGAADLARPGRRRAQRPDRGPSRVHERRRRAAVGHRRPARGHRREGPPPARGRGAGRTAQGARPGAQRARSPSSRTSSARRSPWSAPTPTCSPRSRASTGRSSRDPDAPRHPRRLAPGHARADRAARPPRGLDPRVRARRARPARPTCARSTSRALVDDLLDELGAAAPPPPAAHRRLAPRSTSMADRGPAAPGARAPAGERGQVRAARHARSRSTGGSSRASSASAITDEGPGIPPEWRDRIFEPYARRETHTARGSGIGLYAARRLAESMGARLWCEPAPSGGARFVLALPAAVAV